MALLMALLVIAILSGMGLSIVLLTQSQIQLSQTLRGEDRAYYAALAGLEEVRGRAYGSAPDTIAPFLPTTLHQVLYLVNASASDPVQPTNVASPYYDTEYAQEFSGGFASATVLANLSSDQPGAATSTSIPYKWVRITLKTTDGVDPLYWDGTQLTTSSASGSLVYVITSLAVDATRIRKILQTEIAAAPGISGTSFAPVAAMAAGGSVSFSGNPLWTLIRVLYGNTASANVMVNGNDNNSGAAGCPTPTGALAGVLAGGTVTSSNSSVTGSPASQPAVTPFPQSAATFISQYQSSATSITAVDPSHLTLGSTGYAASTVTLGTPPSSSTFGSERVVYSDQALTISGTGNTGYGVLLVNGNLTISGSWTYQGVIIVNGAVNLSASSNNSILIRGAVLASGSVSANSATGISNSTISTLYDSCAVHQALQGLSSGSASGMASSGSSPQILSYREISF